MRYSEYDARLALDNREVIASIQISGGKSYIEIDGSNPSKAKVALAALEQAKNSVLFSRQDLKSEVNYVYDQEDLPTFDNFGATLIGFIIFFFIFLVSGISFLQERTSGTLEKLLSTPIRRWEIVVGYVLGFGMFTVLQSFLISWYCVYVLKVMMIGSFALIIVPQIFFSGLFDLPPRMEVVGYTMPLYYIADALSEVMIRGSGLEAIAWDLGVMLLCSSLFMTLNRTQDWATLKYGCNIRLCNKGRGYCLGSINFCPCFCFQSLDFLRDLIRTYHDKVHIKPYPPDP